MPKFSDVKKALEKLAVVSEKIENQTFDEKELKLLKNLLTNKKLDSSLVVTQKVDLIDILRQTAVQFSYQYQEVHNQILSELDLSNPNHIRRVYNTLNKELKIQQDLLLHLIHVLSDLEE